ncbi:MAG: hypothetical protein JJ960_08525 [Kordiimonadaceae bacterium]|nr:hypothetical protein [Kordiimonadaceae bacterium]MBO6568781.1 hypothetical protein [Kordiimonadaceae bacterium]
MLLPDLSGTNSYLHYVTGTLACQSALGKKWHFVASMHQWGVDSKKFSQNKCLAFALHAPIWHMSLRHEATFKTNRDCWLLGLRLGWLSTSNSFLLSQTA